MLKFLVSAFVVLAVLAVAVRLMQSRVAFFPMRGVDDTPAASGLRFEAVTLPTADGERLRAWLIPAEMPRALVVYFHGNGGNLSMWQPILAGVVRQGYSVAAIDYRGYGESTGSPSERGVYRDVEAALEWVAGMDRDAPLVVYWGRSLGATMAAYAATKTRPDGLILEAGFPDVRSLLRGSPVMSLLGVFASYRFPAAEFVQTAGCPMLFLHGDADRVIPFERGRALYDAAPQPKRFETIRGGDHNDVQAPDPDRYWSVVREFVDSLPGQR